MTAVFHGYYRSSAAFRVRIALALKKIEAERIYRHLRKGEQRAPEYLNLNPQGLVPTLEMDGMVLTQSMAIIEYLDETHPEPPLLPADAAGRARVRALAQIVACDIHPINNLRILNYLRSEFGQDEGGIAKWVKTWMANGFEAIEQRLSEPATGEFVHGNTPTLADICLIPQVANAGNFKMDLSAYPRVLSIYNRAMQIPAFAASAPAEQPDAE